MKEQLAVSTTSTTRKPWQASATPASCTLHVCTSCRTRGTPREPRENRPGFILFERLRAAIARSPLEGLVEVRPARCLSICPRPCGIALSSPDRWTYLFGDQLSETTIDDVVTCVSLYLDSPDGFMPRSERPKSLRSSILGRVPPLQESPPCT